VKAIELEILRHREQEKREEVRKRFLDAVAEISRRRGREISWALWGRRCCFLCGFLGIGVSLGERRRERM